MKRLLSVMVTLLLICSFCLTCTAGAEEPAPDEKVVAAQYKWDEMIKKYSDLLTAQQLFAARFISDGIAMAAEDDDMLFKAVNECDSLEKFVALLGNGVFCAQDPYSDESVILEKAEGVLHAGAVDIPDCVFVQHFPNGPYKNTECWKVIYGHFADIDYGDGAPVKETIVDYTMYFCGEDYQLIVFMNNEMSGTEEPDTFVIPY